MYFHRFVQIPKIPIVMLITFIVFFSFIFKDTIANLSQQSKITDRSLSTCSCNQDSDSSQIPDTTTNNNKLTTTVGIVLILNTE